MKNNCPLLLLAVFAVSSCAISDEDRCRDGFYFENDNCYKEKDSSTQQPAETDTGGDDSASTDTDTDEGSGSGIGSACSCTGDDCSIMDVPLPTGKPITGCDDVPSWSGAEKACLRSYHGDLAADSYFANGFCTLMAARCEGNEMICGGATLGDYEKMTACPEGNVLVNSSASVDMAGMQADIDSKYCAPACEDDSQCRSDETDSVFGGEKTQYQCLERSGVHFCFDPRNLPEDATAQEF